MLGLCPRRDGRPRLRALRIRHQLLQIMRLHMKSEQDQARILSNHHITCAPDMRYSVGLCDWLASVFCQPDMPQVH